MAGLSKAEGQVVIRASGRRVQGSRRMMEFGLMAGSSRTGTPVLRREPKKDPFWACKRLQTWVGLPGTAPTRVALCGPCARASRRLRSACRPPGPF